MYFTKYVEVHPTKLKHRSVGVYGLLKKIRLLFCKCLSCAHSSQKIINIFLLGAY